MGVKPITRGALIDQIHDLDLRRFDRLIAARALIRGFPAVIKDMRDLVGVVTERMPLTGDVFDVLADAWNDVRENSPA